MFNVDGKIEECEGNHDHWGNEGEAHQAQVVIFGDRVPAAEELIDVVSSPEPDKGNEREAGVNRRNER